MKTEIHKGEAAEKARTPSLPRALGTLFTISFKQYVLSKRTRFVIVIACLPVLISLFWLYVRYAVAPEVNGYSIFAKIMGNFILGYFTIIVTFLYGNMAIAGEVEEGTLFYILTRPVPKYLLISGKYLSLVCSALVILLPPLVLFYFILVIPDGVSVALRNLGILAQDVELLTLAAFAYGAVFLFLGTAFKKSLIIAILYAVVWEAFISFVPLPFRKLTVAHYLYSLSPHISEKNVLVELAGMTTPHGQAIFSLLVISALFLGLSIVAFRRREYIPSEQRG
jgi:ABC-2 type transport system permease protein